MKTISLFLLLAVASVSFAEDKQEPKAVQLNYGLARDYLQNKNSTYFKIVYNDRVLKESGKAPNSTALDSSDLIQADDNNGGTSISFRRGVGALSGNLVEAFGIKPFKLPWAKSKDFMISGGANLNMEGNRRIEVDLGLQLRPFSIMNNSYISNWFTIGAEHSNVTNGGGPNTIDSDMLTFRAFAGRAFNNVVDPTAEKALQDAIKNLTSVAGTEEAAKKYADAHPDNTDKITFYYGLFQQAGPSQKAKGWFLPMLLMYFPGRSNPSTRKLGELSMPRRKDSTD